MHLTKFSDYALRVLLLAAARPGQRLTIEEAAAVFGISNGHLKKVVLALTKAGFLRGIKGRTGGFELARPPADINLGAVLRITEPGFNVFECFSDGATCPLAGPCRLPRLATKAVQGFLAAFDEVTLAEAAIPYDDFKHALFPLPT